MRASSRPPGAEWRALLWLARHPLFVLIPALLVWAMAALGPVAVALAVGVLVLGLLGWSRVHPATFDRLAAPTLRAQRRRWTAYAGRRWAHTLADCDLVRDNRRTGRAAVPRVLRVRSSSPSIDTLYVRMVRGQDLRTWTERADALAEALIAHRVAITRVRPAVLAIVVERELPFDHVIPAPEIPSDPTDVDLGALDVGDNEHGQPFTIRVRSTHGLVAGASGAGKSSLIWSPLRAMGPLIRDRLVRVSMIDLKGGAETQRGARLFHRYATTAADALRLLAEARDEMKRRQDHMREHGLRTLDASAEWPLELVQIDEMAMLTAYGDRADVREALRLLAELLTQGRACGISVWGYVQEPSKDVVDVRELFTTRICLGVTAASHVDMVLGDGARERGALADEIPGDPRHAGIGFVIDTGSRLPVRFRAAYVDDAEIDELVDRCAIHPPATGAGIVPFPHDERNQRDEGAA
ncbi:FtsK/SpoIIIE domain-containing protein [Pseudonocardia bannensis]|uniref:Cell division protein FtsK n=1 Tax=Pseudonocardia bannensis TaxID=630973 RepID=A0A848DFG3_9PSEU|nr:FtsK/SpoIIIE domain-containing protein [Pseudonocardia bannensis]NMH91283.1 cell division protein FtsK [Pseudonocardia bannensis]